MISENWHGMMSSEHAMGTSTQKQLSYGVQFSSTNLHAL